MALGTVQPLKSLRSRGDPWRRDSMVCEGFERLMFVE